MTIRLCNVRLLAESTAAISRLAAPSTRLILSAHSDVSISKSSEEARSDDRALASSHSTATSHPVIGATSTSTSYTPSNQVSSLHKERTIVATESEDDNSLISTSENSTLVDGSGSSIYFDCSPSVSANGRFSVDEWFNVDGSMALINEIHAELSGSPDYKFERMPSFYPEQYTTDGLFSDPIFVVAMLPSRQDHRAHKYYIMYAETPRRWQRVIVSATFFGISNSERGLRGVVSDNDELVCKTLPLKFRKSISSVLADLQLFSSITRINLSFPDTLNLTNPLNIEAVEDSSEVGMCNQEEILQYIEDRGCTQYLESEVSVESRIASTLYKVKVKSQICTERKVPFATAGSGVKNGSREYMNDLKLLKAVQGCSGVSKFIGVVLDDTRTHLRSYLYEHPALGTVDSMIYYANSKSEIIPWFIRLAWSSQIIQAVADVHGRGLAVGGKFHFATIGVRADGSILLIDFKSSDQTSWNFRDLTAPVQRTMGLRAEIFRLAYVLWQLAAHLNTHVNASQLFCDNAGCGAYPRYKCTADHRNPFELPSFPEGVPQYFNNIIRECRSPDPKQRPTASELARTMSDNCHVRIHPVHVENILVRYAASPILSVYCDECGADFVDPHFHCNVCEQANFDLCQNCVEQGMHCHVPQHKLLKRVFKDGSFIHVE